MRTPSKVLTAAALSAAAVLVLAPPAGAHVTVSSSSNAPGSHVTLTFTVPTESETASTTGLTVQLPTDSPLTSVLTQAAPGWSVRTTTTKLPDPLKDDDGNPITSVITKVSWSATGGGIRPGQFGTFALSVGPLPAGGTLFLPAVQHLSDGTDVDWVQQAQGDAEPEHPAPSVVIARAATVSGHASHDGSAPTTSGGVTSATSGGSGNGLGIGLGVAGIVLALLAGGVTGAALARSRRSEALTRVGP